MTTNQKPELKLLSGEASLDEAIAFIESITGKKMTAAEIEELRRELNQIQR